jgi:hypothetical protein
MSFRTPLAVAAILLLSGPAFALATLTGDDAITANFDPNNTSPHLELQVVGSTTETTGGVSLAESNTFDLDIMFKDGGGVDTYDNLILTAALDSGVDNTGVSVTLTINGSSETLTYSLDFPDAEDFTDAEDFGIPFPPLGNDKIDGISNGSGDFLSLNGALVGGFDLMTGLDRGVTDVVTVSLSVTGLGDGSIMRFDIFGTDENGNIIGNNPNSGAAGVVPEPSAALAFGAGVLVVGSTVRRRKR